MSGLLTWLWQGVALTALVSLVLRIAPAMNASTRYCLWWFTLVCVMVLPAAHGVVASRAWSEAVHGDPTPMSRPAYLVITVPSAVDDRMPVVAAALGAMILWRLLRLTRAASRLARLKGQCMPMPAELEDRLTEWRTLRSRGERARLCISNDIDVPAVLGLGRPIIALPSRLMSMLQADQLDLLVTHEYAHVQRHDERHIVVQAFIRAVFGWHPAVWWIGRRLDEERERACDDWVVQHTRQPIQYARCLVDVAAWREVRLGARVLAVGAWSARGHLTRRVERLLQPDRPTTVGLSVTPLAMPVLLIVTAAVASVRLSPLLLVSAQETVVTDVSTGPSDRVWQPLGNQAPPLTRGVTRRSATMADSSRELLADVGPPFPRWSGPTRSVNLSGRRLSTEARDRRPVSADLSALRLVGARSPSTSAAPSTLLPLAAFPVIRHSMPLATPPAPTGGGTMLLAEVRDAPSSPWKQTAETAVAIGRGAAQAGVRTASVFTRMGRAVAGSF